MTLTLVQAFESVKERIQDMLMGEGCDTAGELLIAKSYFAELHLVLEAQEMCLERRFQMFALQEAGALSLRNGRKHEYGCQ